MRTKFRLKPDERVPKKRPEEIADSNGVIWDKKRLENMLNKAETPIDKTLKIRRPDFYNAQRNLFLQSLICAAAPGDLQPYREMPIPQEVTKALDKIEEKEKKESKLMRFLKSPEIQQFFWIYRDGRQLNASEIQKINGHYIPADIPDAEIFTSMMTALDSFFQEAMKSEVSSFKEHSEGDHTICIAKGNRSNLCVIYKNRGAKIWGIEKGLKNTLEKIEDLYKADLEKWNGYTNTFTGCEEKICKDLIKIQKNSKRKKIATALISTIIPSVGIAGMANELGKTTPPAPLIPHAPEIGTMQDYNVTAGDHLNIIIPAFDADGDPLEYSLMWEKNGTFLPINNLTGELNIPAVPESWIGTHSLKAMVKEHSKYNFNVSKLFNLTIKPKPIPIPNEQPYFEVTQILKEKFALNPYIKANDNDTGVGGIFVTLDDKVLYDQINSIIYDKPIDFGNFTPGMHKLSFQAQDATNSSLFSDFWSYIFNTTDKPLLENINLTQNKDDVTLKVSACVETGNVSKIVAELNDKIYEIPLNLREGSAEFKIPLNGLPIKEQKIILYAFADSGNMSEIKKLSVVPYDDPASAKFMLNMLNDSLDWKFIAEDDEKQIVRAEITSDTPTQIAENRNFDPSQQIEVTGHTDFSEDRPGTYKINGIAFLTDGTNVTASANVVVKDDNPIIYAWTINPNTASNDFEVSVSGIDKDTIEEKFVLDVKKGGAEFDKKESVIDSKSFNFKIPLNYTLEEPGQIELTGKLVPKAGELASNFTVFENVPRVILNDKPLIQNFESDYNPINRTVDIKGKVSDIDSKIGSGTYELVNVDTGQKTIGNLLPTDGKFDSRSESFNATAQLEGIGLPEGMYNLTVIMKDAQGLEDKLMKQIRINNTYKIIPVWNEDENAKNSTLIWDEKNQVAYLKLLGNNTLDMEKVNDFEKITTSVLRNYVKENWTKHVVLDDPLESAKRLHQEVIMNLSAGKDPQSGYGDDNILAIDIRTTYEWIKNEILKNQSISNDTKDKWNRFFTFTANYENAFPMALFYYDSNADNKIDNNERWMCYQSKLTPKQYDPSWLFVTEFNIFDITYGTNAAIQWSTEALLDSVDIEHRVQGNNWSDIKLIFNMDKETANNVVSLIKNYNAQPIDNRTQLEQTAGTVFSLYGKKDSAALKGNVLEMRYDAGTKKYTYTVRPTS